MRVDNHTPFPIQLFMWLDGNGRDHVSIIAKATCSLASGVPLREQRPLVMADEPSASGALAAPADIAPRRTGTSVVVRGSVCAPNGEPVSSVRARVRIGPLDKAIVAFGERVWEKHGGRYVPSPPAVFVSVSATLDSAFGGTSECEVVSANPMGRGLLAEERGARGLLLPLIEAPDALIETPDDRPRPASLDALPATCSPRLERAGTYDDNWMRQRAPLWPDDFQEAYFDVASEGLLARPFLRGGEQIELEGLHRAGTIVSTVPRIPIRVNVDSARHVPDLDVVVLEPDNDTVLLTYRCTYDVSRCGLRYPKASIVLLERATGTPL